MSRLSFHLAKALSSARARTGSPTRESILCRLLNKRAAAARAGLGDLEAQLRSQIRWALPVRNPDFSLPDDGAVHPDASLPLHFDGEPSEDSERRP